MRDVLSPRSANNKRNKIKLPHLCRRNL